MSLKKYREESLSVGNGFSQLVHRPLGYIEGCVVTEHGIVDCYSQSDYTQLNFSHNGRYWMRYYDKGYTARGISMIAKIFANDVVAERIKP